jgi:hypothetical protein
MNGNEPPELGSRFVLRFIGSVRGQRALILVKMLVTMDGSVDRPQPAGPDDGSDEVVVDPRHPLVGEARRGESLPGRRPSRGWPASRVPSAR